MRVGDIVTVKYKVKERCCDECGEPAEYKHTFLFHGSRSNPNSSAYGRDDCSYCEDDCDWACEKHKELVRKSSYYVADNMSWCSTFPRKNFKHLFIYKEKMEEEKCE